MMQSALIAGPVAPATLPARAAGADNFRFFRFGGGDG